ncbi:hypothetical protein CR513_52746, partial [Mucuna pruriens]
IVHLCSVCLHSAETKLDCLYRDHLGSVSAESDSASAEEKFKTTEKEVIIKVLNPDRVGQPKSRSTIETFPPHVPLEELKPLPSHLKYAYLDDHQQLLVIIANNLHREQEEKLLQILRHHKKEIGWKLSDLPGISPSIYMHRILLEEEARPIRQQQRRLNLTILDVVKKEVTKEVTKLLAIGIIYPISNSNWVSPVQVVPKKFGMMVTMNRHDEMVPTRIQNN